MLIKKLALRAQTSPRRFHGVAIVSLKDSRWEESEYLIDGDISIIDTSANKPKSAYPLLKNNIKENIKRTEMFSNY